METDVIISIIGGLFAIVGGVLGIWFLFWRRSEKEPGDTSVSVLGSGAARAAGRDAATASDRGTAVRIGDTGPVTVIHSPDSESADRLRSIERQLQELQTKLAPTLEVGPDIGTKELARAAEPDTEARLREALELQDQHKEREAIDALFEAFRKDLKPAAKVQLQILLGNSFFNLSKLEEAEGHYRQALDASLTASLRPGEAAALGKIGLVHAARGEIERAEEHHHQALAIHREIGNRKEEATALGNLGLVYAERGDLERAEEYYRQALATHHEISDRLGEANSLGNLGNVYLERGDLEQAEEHHQQALAIDHEIGNRLGEAQGLGNLGNVYLRLGGLERAEAHYEQALAIDREIGNRLGEANSLGSLGLVAAQRDQQEEACQFLQEAAVIYEEIGAGGPAPDTVRAALQKLGCE